MKRWMMLALLLGSCGTPSRDVQKQENDFALVETQLQG
jgi:hypothetical protein